MQPLRGLTVVSLEQAIAAPYATRQLADLGARVIKVERPGTGDFARGYDHRVNGLSSHFVWVNRNKESLTLDVKDPRGQEVLRRLLADGGPDTDDLAELTPREREVLRCMVDGLKRTEIAERLGLSANTVRTHTQNLLAKLDAHSALEAITVAMRAGMRPSNPGDDPPM